MEALGAGPARKAAAPQSFRVLPVVTKAVNNRRKDHRSSSNVIRMTVAAIVITGFLVFRFLCFSEKWIIGFVDVMFSAFGEG